MLDMKKWSNEIKNLLNQNFGSNTYWEQDYWDNGKYSYTWKMTPYQSVTVSNGDWVPNQDLTPGWSGSNVIPLKLKDGATQISMTLYPNGSHSTNDNMRLVLAYRATDGTPVYSAPVKGNETAILKIDKTPSSTGGSKMAFAIVVNTDYNYSKNPDMRTYHYDYRLKPEEGINGAGDANTKYYNDFKLDYKWPEIGDAPVASSSSVAQSSSSVNPVSSSSEKPTSSSSSVVPATIAASYEIKVTLPIDDNYAPVTASFDVAAVASKLGLTATTLTQATFFAQEPSGNNVTESTANAPGHWFGKTGNVVEWGENAYVFSEADIAKGTLSIGHYPNRVNNGDTYKFTQGLQYNGKAVLFKVTVTLTNEQGNGESTTALMYGLNGTPSHMNVAFRRGQLQVRYTLPQNDNVKVSLFTGFGALIDQKVTGIQNAGGHVQTFDMSEMPAGTYIVKVSTGSYHEARPINITR